MVVREVPGPFRGYRFVDWATQGFLAVVAVLLLLLHQRAPAGWGWVVAGHLAAMGAVHGLIRRAGAGNAGRLERFLREIYPILLYTAFFRETELINRALAWPRLDPAFLRWEHRLFGCQPSVALMDRLPRLAVSELFYAAYFSYYLMVAGLGLVLLVRNRPAFRHFLAVVSFVFYVCYLVHMVVPVIGPRLLFRETHERAWFLREYPQLPPPSYPEPVTHGPFFQIMAFIYRHFEALSAAFPSSHVAVAVTTAWFSWRYLPAIRWGHAVVTALLCVATVYCRYHYAVDVPAGLLVAVILIPIGNRLHARWDAPELRA
ncbi:MAG: phosphatase PAP2 family protein [Verrucomicrobiae bacterium]|nr:phosphatase PAP2 family protein [Verrucomicrobiae bacterium]